MLNILPHVGIEWRPMRTFLSNSFGVFASVVFPWRYGFDLQAVCSNDYFRYRDFYL